MALNVVQNRNGSVPEWMKTDRGRRFQDGDVPLLCFLHSA